MCLDDDSKTGVLPDRLSFSADLRDGRFHLTVSMKHLFLSFVLFILTVGYALPRGLGGDLYAQDNERAPVMTDSILRAKNPSLGLLMRSPIGGGQALQPAGPAGKCIMASTRLDHLAPI